MKKNRVIFSILFINLLIGFIFCSQSFAASIGLGICGRIKKEVRSLKEIKTRNIVLQSLDYSCGPASLSTLLTYNFQDKVSEKEIIDFLFLSGDLGKIKAKNGFSLLDLKSFAQHKGYRVVGYKMDLEFLSELDKPVLIVPVYGRNLQLQ